MTNPKTAFAISRRNLLAASAALALAPIAFGRTAAFAQTVLESGGRKIRTLSDGNLVLPIAFQFGGVPEDELKAFLMANNMDLNEVRPECNLTFLQDGDRTILFDAGSGSNFMPTAGKLPQHLEEAGIDPSSVTDVVFTHGHPDHLWGIVDDFDEITFPEAKLHFPRPEWDFWRSDEAFAKMPPERQTFVAGAQSRLAAIEERVNLFEAGQEVVSGVEAMDTAGHTPGHMSFVIHGEGEAVMVAGDALLNAAASFQKPRWPSGSDQDPDMGIETRVKLLDRLAADKMLVIGYHLPDGGIGRVERKDDAYLFAQAG